MKKQNFKRYAADFETTVFKNQKNTEVWAASMVELYTDEVIVYHSIDDMYKRLKNETSNIIIYFHNLKFDGAFWLDFLFREGLTQAAESLSPDDPFKIKFLDNKDMKNNTFKYSISAMGQWYTIVIKLGGKIIEIRDSLKLLPFSLKRIGESFATKHKKLEMEYTGFRYAGCEITPYELEYIQNDVLVLKEALEIMFNEGHEKLTIGSCCLSEYKKSNMDYGRMFPDVYEMDAPIYTDRESVGEYIRSSYRGGWCYLAKGKGSKLYHNGVTLDVNSLYPSVMHSESGCCYPVGSPTFFKGPKMPLIPHNSYYFIRIKTRFYLRPGYLPFIQIKNTYRYRGTECLETSDIMNDKTGEYSRTYIDLQGREQPATVTLTLTMTDYELIKEHYFLEECEILDGCYFNSEIGIFDDYINKYKEQKLNSKGAKRELAKLFLNNLYGKMASNTDSSFKVAYLKEDGSVGFSLCSEREKKPGYIPVGSAITSYARNFTIRAAQLNYHGPENPGFIYADTDSIHCDLSIEEIIGVKLDDKNFCCWKLETSWNDGYFTRQKTYIEKTGEHYDIKCAGMPQRCKDLFVESITGEEIITNKTDEEKEFTSIRRTIHDFNIGLTVPGKLMPKRIPGGILLVTTTYEMR